MTYAAALALKVGDFGTTDLERQPGNKRRREREIDSFQHDGMGPLD